MVRWLIVMKKRSAVIAVVLGYLAVTGSAQTTVDQLRATLTGATQYAESVVSPDGHWVAWSVTPPAEAASHSSEIWLLDLKRAGAAPHRINALKTLHAEHSVAFSNDSRQLAFLSDAEKKGQLQLYLQPVVGTSVSATPARRVTSLTGFLASPRWSPDGKHIALLYTERAPRAAGPREPAAKDAGVVAEEVFEQRLNIVDVATGQLRAITPSDTYVYE